MNIYVEVQPTRYKDKFMGELKLIKNLVNRIHIPDAPLGYPKASPLALASIAVTMGIKTSIHIRTIDYDETSLINLLYGAYIIGVDRLVFLRGDPPIIGNSCNLLTTEDALSIFHDEERLENNMEVGVLLSMRYSIEKIRERLSLPVDFYLVLNKDRRKCKLLRELTDMELIGYIIIKTQRNSRYLEKWENKADIVDASSLTDHITDFSDCFDSFLISVPQDIGSLPYLIEAFK